MHIRSHLRLVSVLLAGFAGAGLLTVGFGLTPLSGSILGPMLGLGPRGDFSLSSNSPITVNQGQTGTVSVTVTSINHLSGSVSVTATLATSSSNPPVVSTSQSTVNLSSGGTASFSVIVATTTSMSLGDYSITVQGKTGSFSHSITLSVGVTQSTPDFSLSASPPSLLVRLGSNVTGTVNVSSLQSYSGNIALSAVVSPLFSDSPTVSLALTSLKLLAGGTNSTTFIVYPPNFTVGDFNITVTGVSGLLSHSVTIPLTAYGGSGTAIGYKSYSIDSGTQVTLTVQDLGSTSLGFVSYYVIDGNVNQYNLASWNGPVLSPGQTGTLTILIGAGCGGCVLSGSSFVFASGYSYSITLVAQGFQFTWTIGQSASQEHLVYEAVSFSSGTNVTMNIRNTGAVSIQITGYSARDANGNSYSLSPFAGPTIPPNQVAIVSFTIGSSCSGCRLLGSPFTFNIGYNYYIVVATSRGSIFTWQVLR